jgi:hypothetical protein
MASLASVVSITQSAEFFSRFGRFGGDITKLLRLLGNDNLMKKWVGKLDEFPEFRLVHGVFNRPEDVLAAFKARCAARRYANFGKFSWLGSEQAPDFDPNDPETVVVLDATLDTLQHTFEFAWEWMAAGQDSISSWGIVSDPRNLRLLSDDRDNKAEGDGPDFKPWTLSWRRIKLDTNIDMAPRHVCNQERPGCALLWMCAEHPERIKATDYKKRFGFWLAGLKCRASGENIWSGVPRVDLKLFDRQVMLTMGQYDDADSYFAVPSFLESGEAG